MTTFVSTTRNVNGAFAHLIQLETQDDLWRTISPRGMETKEFRGTFITEYTHPRERVLFHQERDANPFFHFFESLWILAGREDVAYLEQFNSHIKTFSDDGKTFHAAYGYRMRKYCADTTECDQLVGVIELLRKDPDTRRAVMCFWDPVLDLGMITTRGEFIGAVSKDIPCNDLLMFKLREGELDLTVSCRSNDAVWGAYGANAVQFSVIQEIVARAVGAEVGTYKQISDSFHIYSDNGAWNRVKASASFSNQDAYSAVHIHPYCMMKDTDYRWWLQQCERFVSFDGMLYDAPDPFFAEVAAPMLSAHKAYRGQATSSQVSRNDRIDIALQDIQECRADDWRIACVEWLRRRRQ